MESVKNMNFCGFFLLFLFYIFLFCVILNGVMVLFYGGVSMAYFLKVSKQQSRTYLSIYESFYSPEVKGTRHRSFKSLGNIDKIIESGIDDPIAYYQKVVDRMNQERKQKIQSEKTNRKLISDQSPERYLGYFPLANILNTLDVQQHFRHMQSSRNFQSDVFDIFSSLVFARAVAPHSKHKTFHDILPSLFKDVSFSYDQLLDAVEFMGGEYEKLTEILTAAVMDNYGVDTSFSFFDCTNFYFEIDRENDFQRKGPSKENRKDPIVGMGLLLDANMIPIGMKMYPGNESEKPVLRSVIESLRKQNNIKGRTIQIADKGLNCARNIIEASSAGDGYIFSKSVKQLSAVEKNWVYLDEGYKDVYDRDGKVLYRYKSCIDMYKYTYEDENGRKYTKKVKEKRICTFNPKLQRKKLAEISRMVEKAKTMKASQAKKEEYGESAKYVIFTDGKGKKAEVRVNTKAIEKDRKAAGYNMLVTSEYTLDDQKIYDAYHRLWRIEESFRVMKSELDARPVYLQKENSIKGHFFICYAAVLLIRILQVKVLKNAYSTGEICRFIKDFRVTKINDNRYINMMRSSDFITDLSIILNQPITNYFLTDKQIKMMHTR